MATVAGDEITETIMKEYLVDFDTAEKIKAQIDTEEVLTFNNILGIEQKLSKETIFESIQHTSDQLCKEIAEKIIEINGTAPSALFLAGGGSKLAGLKEGLTAALEMDANRVAVAGNYFQASAYSEEYDLNNPVYTTPLGIVISSGLNLINDSFRVVLNNKPAKLFRSGSFTALNLLMMNGYQFRDILGRSGANLSVTVNGERKIFYGTAAQPASLLINKKEGKLSDVIHAGDVIDFLPAIHGMPAKAFLEDIEGASSALELTLNGKRASLKTLLKNGDAILIHRDPAKSKESQVTEAMPSEETFEASEPEPEPASESEFIPENEPELVPIEIPSLQEPVLAPTPKPAPPTPPPLPDITFYLNDAPLRLPPKEDGSPYYLTDMIQYSGLDLQNITGKVSLLVNGREGRFQQSLKNGDTIYIKEEIS